MQQETISAPAYVIKPEELLALNFLADDHPRPVDAEWINRGTDQKLKPSTVQMLQRTLFRDMAPPSVVQLHRSAGLRVIFRNDQDRQSFAAAFAAAREQESQRRKTTVTATFDSREEAETAIAALVDSGFAEERISLIWRVSQLEGHAPKLREGHSKLSVASAIAGGGVAGALLGVAVLVVPGLGPIAAAGAIAAAAPSVAGVSGVIGATGGAITRMLDDHDVEDIASNYHEQQINRGKVFVTVDVTDDDMRRDEARALFRQFGGKSTLRA